MKKSITTAFLALLVFPFLSAQEPAFSLGDKVLNVGLGLGSTLYSGYYYNTTVPPVSISFEQGIVDEVLEKGVIGVGGYLGYSGYKYDYLGWGWRYSNIILGARGNFHYPLLDNLDTYTGVLLGWNIVSSSEFGTNPGGIDYSATSGGLAFSWYVGGRYYFGQSFAVMAEVGYGIAWLNLGISLKF